ncbi:MAG: hypothetical protein MI702_09020, partial [Chlorobiales bacterium]|nr:hypothetical protein [Chlorobiales bacterium]
MILHKGFQTVALIIVCILISTHVFAQDTDDFLVVGGSIALNFDGTNEFSYIVKDKDTGTFRYVSSIPENRTTSLTSSDSWPLTVDGIVRWPLGKIIEYGFTPDALQGNRKRIITDIIDTYV